MDFAATMTGLTPAKAGASARVERDLAQLRKVSGEVLGSVFFGTLLKSMRESPLKGEYGHGGRGEEVFSAQLHQIYAERVGDSVQNGVTQAIYKRLEHQQRLYSAQRTLD